MAPERECGVLFLSVVGATFSGTVNWRRSGSTRGQYLPEVSQYIGIAADEPKRLRRLGDHEVSLLEKYNYTEDDAKQLCQKAGLLSPVYDFAKRGGCWFCPKASKRELRHIYDFHPELWERMLALQRLPDLVSQRFNRVESFSDINKRFTQDDDALLRPEQRKGNIYA